MPTCRSSASSARVLATLALLLATSAPSQAQTSATPPPAQTSAEDNARAKTQRAGDAAMDRLKEAAAARKHEAEIRGPTALPPPTPEMRRKAFDGLRGRAPSPAMDVRAKAALDKGKEAVAAERDAMAKRLGQALGLEQPDIKAIAGVAAPPSAKGWVPVLFVSSSMPIATLRTYAVQLEKARGVLAFRGVPGGLRKIGPMAKLSADVLRLDPGCEGPACAMRDVQIIVDPLIFRQHGVARVPALVMAPGDPTAPYCERDDDSPRGAHVVYGDAALFGLLDEYARLGGKEDVRDAQSRLQGR